MKTLKSILTEYKETLRQAKKKAAIYNELQCRLNSGDSTRETFRAYRSAWLDLLDLDDKVYKLQYEYKELASSVFYKMLFALRILPKQNARTAKGVLSLLHIEN